MDTIHQRDRDRQTDRHRTTAKTALTHSVARKKNELQQDNIKRKQIKTVIKRDCTVREFKTTRRSCLRLSRSKGTQRQVFCSWKHVNKDLLSDNIDCCDYVSDVIKTFFQDQDQDFMIQDQDQDQDQDFHFCPRGASRPRPWSRGLHHWIMCCIRKIRSVFVVFRRCRGTDNVSLPRKEVDR